jgi:hypothetical protein
VVSKHFIVDVALGRVGVATKGRTLQLGRSDGMLPENFELLDSRRCIFQHLFSRYKKIIF